MVQNSIKPIRPEIDPARPENSVSVIIPVYNGAQFIAETIHSILCQTVPPLEVIVVNDGSTDDTPVVVKGFGDAVTLINTPNGGPCKARNIGAAVAKGNWLAFCDGDDLWLPDKLERQLKLATEAPDLHCVLTDYAEINNGILSGRSHFSYMPRDYWMPERHWNGFVIRHSITGKLTTFQPAIASTPLVKRDFYVRVGGFDETPLGPANDTCFHFRCLRILPFGVVPKVLMHYRRHPDSLSANPTRQLRSSLRVWAHILSEYPAAQHYREELLQGLSAMRREIAQREFYEARQRLKQFLGFQ